MKESERGVCDANGAIPHRPKERCISHKKMKDWIQTFIGFVGLMMAIVMMLVVIIFIGNYLQMISIRDSRLYVCTSFESAELRDQCRTRIVNGETEKNDR